MSDKDIRKLVEDPHAHEEIETARNLPDAANSSQSLEGYAAVNALSEDDEIARLAHKYFLQRQKEGGTGSADDDWFRAEQEVRRTRRTTDI